MGESENMTSYPLFLDEPTDMDRLSFDAVASTVVDAVLDPCLDQIALGLSGSWGSGKTSVLRLIGRQLQPAEGETPTRLVIETDPWRYDPQLGIKESLLGEILTAIMDAGWSVDFEEGDYLWTGLHPASGAVIHFVEGDLYCLMEGKVAL
ncbi:P-loop NTPase fold protein [Microbacterium murale]|uniref:KAP NTPase domain-containing protein n=1 Tax=Microbacterium murale TaxID=1081040 RepID=A0ABU0P3Z3_9MICO|nr:P-loop NTPase fold protein [Microbacterium murale]MDQ0642049.1 hypothetical protein [Microbacterium murale]